MKSEKGICLHFLLSIFYIFAREPKTLTFNLLYALFCGHALMLLCELLIITCRKLPSGRQSSQVSTRLSSYSSLAMSQLSRALAPDSQTLSHSLIVVYVCCLNRSFRTEYALLVLSFLNVFLVT